MKKRHRKRFMIRTLAVLASIALLSPFLANHRPLYLKYNGCHFFPAFSFKHIVKAGNAEINYDIEDFKTFPAEAKILAPIVWSPGKSDFLNSNVGPFDKQTMRDLSGNTVEMPFRFRHWLGTNSLGADVLSGLIHGFRYSFLIALIAILVASLFGITLGAMAGYFGNKKLLVENASVFSSLIVLLYFLFYIFNKGKFQLQNASQTGNFHLLFVLSIILLCFAILYILIRFVLRKINSGYFKKSSILPVDSIVLRAMEITLSIPRLILIISLAALAPPSLINLGIIIGISLWTDIARFTRAQAVQLREQDFISAAHALGFSNKRILIRHVLLNGMGPVLVVICFAFSSVILTESGLSFIGIGMPRDAVTWGSMLSSVRENAEAWWLTVFPGCCIMFTVLFFNKLADYYYKRTDLILP